MGYEDLTPIQEDAIQHILDGRDLVGLAETGSGKTGACGVPLVQMVDPSIREIQAMILVPTRELAQQYVGELADISRRSKVAPFAMYGGFDMDIQRAKLKDGVHILVATPGRFIDYLWNNPLPLNHVRTMVLDEADEMLNMGFAENVEFIMSCVMQEHQTLLFAATMPKEVDQLARSYLKDPVRLELIKDRVAPQSLEHHFRHVRFPERLDALKAYLKEEQIVQAIIFCNSRGNGTRLFGDLKRTFPSVDYIHGGLVQGQRTSIFNKFRKKNIRFLVATDVASRGLDFDHVTHVINYDFPRSREGYTHRTGRAGRMGRLGVAMSFVTDREMGGVARILRANQIEPVWQGRVPDLKRSGKARQGRRSYGRQGRSRGRRR
ncbi:MAG: DEAD/DEAH box helicase [bacterium]|nr:DEAD/DEAH box helicase [bacterium]